MKNKTFIILTLFILFNFTYSSAQENIEIKEELNESKADSEYKVYFHREEGFVYKPVNDNRNINPQKKIAYTGAFTIKKSDKENIHLKFISIFTKKPMSFIGVFKLEYRTVYITNNKFSYVKWKAKVYDGDMKHVGYCVRELKRRAPNRDGYTTNVFFDLKNEKIGNLHMRREKSYKEPPFIKKNINGVIVPQITVGLINKFLRNPHYYTGLIYKLDR